MSSITYVNGTEILDSRGNPTVEVEVLLDDGSYGRAAVPSGASTGDGEALEMRDGDATRYCGKGVLKAIDQVNTVIAEEIEGRDALDQAGIDGAMIALDGTENKSKLGANAILGVSMAVARAAAMSVGLPLYRYLGGVHALEMPVPMANIINGGKHSDNLIDFQEYMIVPLKAPCFREALRMATEVFHSLKSILKRERQITAVGDEGGFAPNVENVQALDFIMEAIEKTGYKPGVDFGIALDCAASELFNEGERKGYKFWKSAPNKVLDADGMIELFKGWVRGYPIVSIEDPLDQNDWEGYAKMTAEMGDKVQIVGDDFFVTNTKLLKKGIEMGACNAILIKLNQIGTLTETIDAVRMAQKAGYKAIISHRSGETEDTFIADLAVALETGQIKTGSMSRSDRIAKYNQLLRIEDEVGSLARYSGKKVFE